MGPGWDLRQRRLHSEKTDASGDHINLGVIISVTRWLDYCSIFGHLQKRKFAQCHKNCQNSFKILPRPKLTLHNLPKTF